MRFEFSDLSHPLVRASGEAPAPGEDDSPGVVVVLREGHVIDLRATARSITRAAREAAARAPAARVLWLATCPRDDAAVRQRSGVELCAELRAKYGLAP